MAKKNAIVKKLPIVESLGMLTLSSVRVTKELCFIFHCLINSLNYTKRLRNNTSLIKISTNCASSLGMHGSTYSKTCLSGHLSMTYTCL